MKVLVTGADGFIGSRIAALLARSGHEVTSAVFARAARVREVRVDLTRAAELIALPSDVQAIVHTAGIVDPRVKARVMAQVNVGGTENLARWAKQRGVAHFVQLSSVAVYGPLVLGEQRSEDTPRLGLTLGLPYMRTKARAERVVERAGVPFTHVRPPAVLGPFDTVLTRGFADALAGPGLPLVAGAQPGRRVSLSFVAGLAELVRALLAHGPLGGPIHAIDAEPTLEELASLYARALGKGCAFASTPWSEALRRRADAGFAWLVASARFGQHYSGARASALFPGRPLLPIEDAVHEAVSSLQGNTPALS